MEIITLTLKGYKRIALSNIQYLKLNVSSVYQIILGTNGSGKSSLLSQLTPLPAIPADYHKGGFKEIVVRHHNVEYTLTSNFEGRNHHSFIKHIDGEPVELNEGGTISVQRELVKQEFGITKEIHDVLSGKLKFTTMSPSKRREIITMMSNTDLTYAMKIFKQIATITRDNQGAINHINSRIAKETQRLMSIETDEDLNVVVEQLQSELTQLMEQKRPNIPSEQSVRERLQRYCHEAHEIAEQIFKQPFEQTDNLYLSAESMQEAIHRQRQHISSEEAVLSHQSSDYEKYQKLVGDLDITGGQDVGSLEKKIEELNNQLLTEQSKIHQFSFSGDITHLHQHSQQVKGQFIDILSTLPDNSDRRFNRQRLTEVEELITQERSVMDKALAKMRRCEHDLEHMNANDGTTCPKCKHTWHVGIAEISLPKLKEIIGQYRETAKLAENRMVVLCEEREAIQHYASQFSRLRSLNHQYPSTDTLVDWLFDEDRIYHQPSQYVPVVDNWIMDVHTTHRIQQIKNELRSTEDVLTKTKLLAEHGNHHVRETLAELTVKIEQTTSNIQRLRQEIAELEQRLQHANRMTQLGDQLDSLLQKINDDQSLHYDCIQDSVLGDVIRSHQTQLALATQKHNEQKAIRDIIDDLKSSLADVESSHQVHKLLCSALSPTDGLIAKQMTAFIECLTEQITDVISQIYTYPLVVQPCGIESNGLDYRFPLLVGNNDTPANDVGDGSEGQQEIINFAFKLVATLYLGFNDYPLYVDELGQNQDETHLVNVMNYVKMLVESHRHTQLFMISHFASSFGAFTNADFLVLNGANISVPQKHNLHVEIS